MEIAMIDFDLMGITSDGPRRFCRHPWNRPRFGKRPYSGNLCCGWRWLNFDSSRRKSRQTRWCFWNSGFWKLAGCQCCLLRPDDSSLIGRHRADYWLPSGRRQADYSPPFDPPPGDSFDRLLPGPCSNDRLPAD
jgi:hypothetical protein